MFIKYSVTLLYFCTLYAFSRVMHSQSELAISLFALLITIPIAMRCLYIADIRRRIEYSTLKSSGIIRTFFTGKIIRTILWLLFAFVINHYLLAKSLLLTNTDCKLIIGFIFVQVCIFGIVKNFIRTEAKEYVLVYWSLMITSFLLLIVFVASAIFFEIYKVDIIQYDSINTAIESIKQGIMMPNSALLRYILKYLIYSQGIENYLLGLQDINSEYLETAHLIYVFADNTLYIISIFALSSAFLIGFKDYKIIFMDEESGEASPFRIVFFIIISLVLTTGYVPFIAKTNYYLAKQEVQVTAFVEDSILPVFDKIGNDLYVLGTVEEVEKIKEKYTHEMQLLKIKAIAQVDMSFERMVQRVDVYLDWYYSLGAEYMRLLTLVSGGVEEFLQEKFMEHIVGNESVQFQASLESLKNMNNKIKSRFDLEVEQLKQKNLIVDVPKDYKINNILGVDFWSFPYADAISFDTRFFSSSTVGLGAAAAVIAKKTFVKTAVKTTAKTGAKQVLSGIGAGIAGLLGCLSGPAFPIVVPVVAVITYIIISVIFDTIFLAAEEAISREEHKQEILKALEDAKNQMIHEQITF